MNAKMRRKARREDLPPVRVEPVSVVTIGVVARVQWLTHPCPVCGLVELRRVAGDDRLYCYRCRQWQADRPS
jgi:hypothetical protein